MRTPTEAELQHLAVGYDPVKAHEYYERTKRLKGRRRGRQDPRTGKTREQISRDARATQRRELAIRIQSLQRKLNQLETKIREMERAEASEDRKSKAKKERAAKERNKPKTAAEKAEAARESKKYREQHRQELRNKAKKARDKSGGGSSSKKSKSGTESISALRTMATKIKGQIAVAKQKLAAL